MKQFNLSVCPPARPSVTVTDTVTVTVMVTVTDMVRVRVTVTVTVAVAVTVTVTVTVAVTVTVTDSFYWLTQDSFYWLGGGLPWYGAECSLGEQCKKSQVQDLSMNIVILP